MKKENKNYSAEVLLEAMAFDDECVKILALDCITESLLYDDEPILPWEKLPLGWNPQMPVDQKFVRRFYRTLDSCIKEKVEIAAWEKLLSKFWQAVDQKFPTIKSSEFYYAVYGFVRSAPFQLMPQVLNLIARLKPFNSGYEANLLCDLFVRRITSPGIDYYDLIFEVSKELDEFPELFVPIANSVNQVSWKDCYLDNPQQFLEFLNCFASKKNLRNAEELFNMAVQVLNQGEPGEEILLQKIFAQILSNSRSDLSLQNLCKALRETFSNRSKEFQLSVIKTLIDLTEEKTDINLDSIAWDFETPLSKIALDEQFRDQAYVQFQRIQECKSVDFMKGMWTFILSAARSNNLELMENYVSHLDCQFRLVRGHKGFCFFHIIRKLLEIDLKRFEKLVASLLNKYVFAVEPVNLIDLLTFLQHYPQFAEATLSNLKCVISCSSKAKDANLKIWYDYLISNNVHSAFPQIQEILLKDLGYADYFQDYQQKQLRKQALIDLLS